MTKSEQIKMLQMELKDCRSELKEKESELKNFRDREQSLLCREKAFIAKRAATGVDVLAALVLSAMLARPIVGIVTANPAFPTYKEML